MITIRLLPVSLRMLRGAVAVFLSAPALPVSREVFTVRFTRGHKDGAKSRSQKNRLTFHVTKDIMITYNRRFTVRGEGYESKERSMLHRISWDLID